MRMESFRTVTKRNSLWKRTRRSIKELAGCSHTHQQPLAAAISSKTTVRAVSKLPNLTLGREVSPMGCVRLLMVDPRDLSLECDMTLLIFT